MTQGVETSIEYKHTTKYSDLEPSDLHLSEELMPDSEILTKGTVKLVRHHVIQLNHYIPEFIRTDGWMLYYSRSRDGTSFNTALTNCFKRGEVFIIIQDSHNNLFGGYLSSDLEKRDDFFGTGETFLTRISVGI